MAENQHTAGSDHGFEVAQCEACGQPLPRESGALGTLLRLQRAKLRMTLRAVEAASGGSISNAYLSQLETGRVKDPSATMVLNLAAVLHLDVDAILRAIDPALCLALNAKAGTP